MRQLEHPSGLDGEVGVVSGRGKVGFVHVEGVAPARLPCLGAALLVGLLSSGPAFLNLGDNLSILAHHHFPLVSIADDVRFIDGLALALFRGDVLQLRADQFALDRLPHGGRGLIEAHFGLARSSGLTGAGLHSSATECSDQK